MSRMLDEIVPEAGAFYVMDRGYIDFERLYVFSLSAAFFVVRTKRSVFCNGVYSHDVDKSTGVRSDHTVVLTAINSIRSIRMRCAASAVLLTRKRTSASGFLPTTSSYRTYHRPDLQVALASGTLLQMDQTAFADQGILRPERERE